MRKGNRCGTRVFTSVKVGPFTSSGTAGECCYKSQGTVAHSTLSYTAHHPHTHTQPHVHSRTYTYRYTLSHTYHWQMVPYFNPCFLISNTKQTQFCKRLIPKEELLPQCPKLSPLLWQQHLKKFAEARDLSRTSRFPFMIFPLEKRFLFDFISWFGSYWRTVSTAPNPLNVLIFEVVTHPSQPPALSLPFNPLIHQIDPSVQDGR